MRPKFPPATLPLKCSCVYYLYLANESSTVIQTLSVLCFNEIMCLASLLSLSIRGDHSRCRAEERSGWIDQEMRGRERRGEEGRGGEGEKSREEEWIDQERIQDEREEETRGEI